MGKPEDHANPQASSEDAREQRIDALRELAQTTSQTASAGTTYPPHIPQRRSRRTLWIILTGVIMICAIGILLARNLFLGSVSASTDPVVLDPTQLHLACIHDAAWSPDGASIAVLGYQTQCPSNQPTSYAYETGLVVIYSTKTGKASAPIYLDSPIDAALHLQAPAVATPPVDARFANTSKQAIAYSQLLWAPDGKQVAIPFTVSVATHFHQSAAGQVTWDAALTAGILLIGTHDMTARVLSHKVSPQEVGSSRWNIDTGEYLGSGIPQTAPAGTASALDYSWDASGNLTPQIPSATSSTPTTQPLGSVGNPDGGSAFTIWQPARVGALHIAPAPGEAPATISGVYVFVSVFAVWSPDGKFLITYGNFSGLLGDVGKVTPSMRQQLEPPPLPEIPVRDKGLAQVLSQITAQDGSEFRVAWSHNGRLLAAETSSVGANGKLNPGSVIVSIYDCASGKRLTTIHPAGTFPSTTPTDSPVTTSVGFNATLLQWSPDDKHVLVYDENLSTLMIFDAGRLSREA